MNWMMKNSSGKPDGMFTFAVLSWIVAVICIVGPMFNGFVIPFTDYVVTVNSPDASLVIAFLGATFTSYVVRKNKKEQLSFEESTYEGDENE